jgi:hypothetical protein
VQCVCVVLVLLEIREAVELGHGKKLLAPSDEVFLPPVRAKFLFFVSSDACFFVFWPRS